MCSQQPQHTNIMNTTFNSHAESVDLEKKMFIQQIYTCQYNIGNVPYMN